MNFLDTLSSLGTTAADIYGSLSGKPATAPSAPAPAAPAAKSFTAYLPWLIGGAVVLFLGIFLLRKN